MTRSTFTPVLLAFVTLSAFTVSYLKLFHGGQTYEFCHYAEIASHLLKGDGYTTQTFYPSELAFLEQSGIDVAHTYRAPVLFRFPLAAWWDALWMRLAGTNDFGMALANGMAHVFWVISLYLFGRRITRPEVAGLSALLWAFQPVMIGGFDLAGQPDILFGWLFLVHCVFFWEYTYADGIQPFSKLFSVGLLGGLCFLSRQNFAFWIPLFLLLIFRSDRQRGARPLVAYLLGLAPGLIGWFLYYHAHFHRFANPLIFNELAESTLMFRLPWMEYQTFSWEIFSQPGFASALTHKFIVYFVRALRDLPMLWFQPLFFMGFVFAVIKKSTQTFTFARFIALLFAWQLFVFSFLRYESMGLLSGRYYLWIAPLMILCALDVLARIKIPSIRYGAISLMCVAQLSFWIVIFINLPAQYSNPIKEPNIGSWKELGYVRSEPNSQWIASNIPTQITWYTDHPTLLIPNTLRDFEKMSRQYDIRILVISTHWVGELPNYPDWQWVADTPQQLPPLLQQLGFKFDRQFPTAVCYRRS